MKKKDLIIRLVRFRFTRNGLLQGFTSGEAAIMAEQRLKNEGLFGFFSSAKLMALPEGAIVHIVETYWQGMLQQIAANPAVAQLSENNLDRQAMIQQFSARACEHIENNRSRFFKGSEIYPKDIFGYVVYRMKTELKQIHHVSPDSMGFDDETIDFMAKDAYQYFLSQAAEL